jgi:restriction endonuclease Mrr
MLGTGNTQPKADYAGQHLRVIYIASDQPKAEVAGMAEARPRGTLSAAVEEANAAVAAEVLDRVQGRETAFVEHLVLDVLTTMG